MIHSLYSIKINYQERYRSETFQKKSGLQVYYLASKNCRTRILTFQVLRYRISGISAYGRLFKEVNDLFFNFVEFNDPLFTLGEVNDPW